jgi:hypothetical protein
MKNEEASRQLLAFCFFILHSYFYLSGQCVMAYMTMLTPSFSAESEV